MAGWREVVAVAAGGVIGTGLRFTLDTVIPHTDSQFPLSTLLVNIVGSFALGTLVSTLWRRARTPNWLKVGLGTGTVGSFTTFSALIVSLVTEAHHGLWMLAVLYLVLSLVLGFGAALLGLSVGRRPRPAPLEIDMVDE
ncbi:CrcB family protein [Glaciihabitans sp. INWT7]|uniref:fluoride efflux transporter FluC n=1 Tax=Glaciihabitans sp. INWT7 TaxID=2596912 RepID=UPI00162496CD|nr:CrcB family protein [Glaciihabitans sp. INWT7]QNE48088.1 CrcB family protein [Glaciihabitans sp. INWT7]